MNAPYINIRFGQQTCEMCISNQNNLLQTSSTSPVWVHVDREVISFCLFIARIVSRGMSGQPAVASVAVLRTLFLFSNGIPVGLVAFLKMIH